MADPAARQRRIGLTGGIATGKSTVGRLLRDRHGLPLLDADREARAVLADGSEATAAVLQRYGPAVRHGDGGQGLDRAALARIVFADAAERAWLERLVHPQVRRRLRAALATVRAAPAVVLMIPLLFEAGLEDLCSEVWVVSCPESVQRSRLMARDGLGDAEARRRIAAQWPLARKRALADRIVSNDGSPEELTRAVARAVAEAGLPVGG
jgi:dephospho-CoA kinase